MNTLPENTPSQYLSFWRDNHYQGRTVRIVVTSKRHLAILGEIKWFGRWRQYAFFPEIETVWNPECLDDVNECIARLTQERKNKTNEMDTTP